MPLWTLTLVGYYLSGAEGVIHKFAWLPRGRLALSLLVYSLLMGSVYILNQIFDRDTDRLNEKLHLLSKGYISLWAGWGECVLLVLISIGLSLLFSPAYRVFLLLSLALGVLYSAPPFKFKGRPFLDILSNSIGYGSLAFMVGWLTSGKYEPGHLLKSLPYVLAVAAVFINTTVPDIEGDRKTGNNTTGVFLGIRRTTGLALLAILGAVGISLWTGDLLCLIPSLAATPLFLWAALDARVKPAMVSYQLSVGILGIMLCLIFPWYLLLLLFTIGALFAYHKLRFGMNFPALADRG